jgi:hypothetical protein
MEFSSYQLGVVVIGILAFLFGVSAGIWFALGVYAGAAVALVLSVIAWGVTYAITAGRR